MSIKDNLPKQCPDCAGEIECTSRSGRQKSYYLTCKQCGTKFIFKFATMEFVKSKTKKHEDADSAYQARLASNRQSYKRQKEKRDAEFGKPKIGRPISHKWRDSDESFKSKTETRQKKEKPCNTEKIEKQPKQVKKTDPIVSDKKETVFYHPTRWRVEDAIEDRRINFDPLFV